MNFGERGDSLTLHLAIRGASRLYLTMLRKPCGVGDRTGFVVSMACALTPELSLLSPKHAGSPTISKMLRVHKNLRNDPYPQRQSSTNLTDSSHIFLQTQIIHIISFLTFLLQIVSVICFCNLMPSLSPFQYI